MTSTISSTKANRSSFQEFHDFYLWSLKRTRGILILFTVLLLLAVPLTLALNLNGILQNPHITDVPRALSDAYYGHIDVIIPLAVVPLSLLLGVILDVNLYGYMQKKRSVDLYHAMPVGRTPLFLSRYFCGLTVLYLPLFLTFIILYVMEMAYGVQIPEPGATLLIIRLLNVLLASTAAFTFTTFMTVCSGTMFDAIISVVVVSVTYPLMVTVGGMAISMIVPGMSNYSMMDPTFDTAFSPYIAAFIPSFRGVSLVPYYIWWILLTLVLFAASILLYRKRKSECAESNFAFPIPKTIIRFVATFAAAVCTGMIFIAMFENSTFNFLFGAVIGSLCTHVIAEAVYSRGFKGLKKSFLYYGIFAVVFASSYGIAVTGCLGYDAKVPNTAEVKSVTVELPSYLWSQAYADISGFSIYGSQNNKLLATVEPSMQNQESIEKAVALHQEIIKRYREHSYPYQVTHDGYRNIRFTYHLKNGSTLSREYASYDIPGGENDDSFKQYLTDIYNLQEYRENANPLFYLEADAIDSINVYSDYAGSKDLSKTLTTEQAGRLLEALRYDISHYRANPDGTINTSNLTLDLSLGSFVPKEERTKALIKDYSGSVVIRANTIYSLDENFAKTIEFLDSLGMMDLEVE